MVRHSSNISWVDLLTPEYLYHLLPLSEDAENAKLLCRLTRSESAKFIVLPLGTRLDKAESNWVIIRAPSRSGTYNPDDMAIGKVRRPLEAKKDNENGYLSDESDFYGTLPPISSFQVSFGKLTMNLRRRGYQTGPRATSILLQCPRMVELHLSLAHIHRQHQPSNNCPHHTTRTL